MKKLCIYSGGDDEGLIYSSSWYKPLKTLLELNGYEIVYSKNEEEDKKDYHKIIYINMPVRRPECPEKSYVWIAEPPVIYSRNFKRKRYNDFKKVFTWHDDFVNGKNIIKLNYPQNFKDIDFDLTKKTKFCALFAANKHSRRPNELFSERQKAIKWFDNNALGDLDLYGRGWEKGLIEHFLFVDIKRPKPKCHKGSVLHKEEVLKDYKFSICYENWLNDVGYITEKIFDCFNASNVPVYLGATNIEKYIPSSCYIDKRQFKNYEDLYNFMKNMSDEVYLEYLDSIQKFIKSDKAQNFEVKMCVQTIVSEVLK